MKKIPTVFDRDWNGDRSRVVNVPHRDCAWVFAGEGVATQKIDGTCCLIRDGKFYKRRELRKGEAAPAGFEIADHDEETGKTVGWMPVGERPEDRWHREAFAAGVAGGLPDGTYELIGPKVQGNPEEFPKNTLVRHETLYYVTQPPRDFDGLREWMNGKDIEGIVFHHPDGRMAKIKLRDFGLKRNSRRRKQFTHEPP
jgi:hypothetical protein